MDETQFEPMEEDVHVFGYSDYLNANEYSVKSRVKFIPRKFLGRRPYTDRNKQKKRAGFYRVDSEGRQKEYRLGVENEKILRTDWQITSYEQIIGAEITAEVKGYGLGHGFVIVDVVKGSSSATSPSSSTTEQPSDKQRNFMNLLFSQLKIEDKQAFLSSLFITDVPALASLSREQIKLVIDRLQEIKKEKENTG